MPYLYMAAITEISLLLVAITELCGDVPIRDLPLLVLETTENPASSIKTRFLPTIYNILRLKSSTYSLFVTV